MDKLLEKISEANSVNELWLAYSNVTAYLIAQQGDFNEQSVVTSCALSKLLELLSKDQ